MACLEFTVPLSRSDTASDVDLDFCERRVFGLRSLVGEPIFPNSKDFVVARCNSEACTRFVQAHGALACMERALQIVDALELSSLIGARIQHAMDALESELRRLEGIADAGE